MTRATFGVDLGGTNLRAAVVDRDGTIADERRAATPATLDEIVAAIASAVDELAPVKPDVGAVGIGAAGMVDFDGVINYAPNVPAFVRAPLRELVADATGRSVVVDNDANVAALAELTHGAAQGFDNLLLVTLGTGIGGGVVVGGKVVRGAHGFGAEIGHFQVDPNGPMCVCGEVGHWEAVASGNALGALGRARAAAGEAGSILARVGGDVEAIRGVHVGDAAQSGAPDAVALLREYAQQVAVGLVGLANILDPQVILISGGLVELGGVLLDPLREWFEGHIEGARYRAAIEILPAALGEEAGVVGAAVLARTLDA
ncbi:MAG: ROK family protein [Acidimicrobiia bacterium]